jgi:chaperonin cofactor prefoldin
MRKLRPHSEESIDLLLDTICDVFGGFVFIACLLALLSNQHTPVSGDPNGISGTQGRLLTERIEAAKSELAGLQKISETRKSKGQDELQTLNSERNELQATLDRLRKLQPTNSDTTVSKDPVGDLTVLRSEVKALDQLHEDAKARKDAADQKARDLAGQIQSLRSKITTEDEKRTEHVRFPKEREITKSPQNLLLKYGAIYPLQDASGDKFPGITRIMKGGEDFDAIPQKSRGIPISDIATLRRLLASYKRWGSYVSLNVYPDSFEAFRAIKMLILEAGLDYGFDVYPEHFIITFSPKGASPAPL